MSGWLDDIGLPQYKSHFDEARVDGRMLHYMTVVSCQNFLKPGHLSLEPVWKLGKILDIKFCFGKSSS